MQCSERFLKFVHQQLMGFQAESEIDHLVVYVAKSSDGGAPTLEMVGQWPNSKKVLQPVEADPALRKPSSNRRWYPLQEGSILLGAIRAERVSSFVSALRASSLGTVVRTFLCVSPLRTLKIMFSYFRFPAFTGQLFCTI